MTEEDLFKLYSNYPLEKIVKIYSNLDNYSNEAKSAINRVIDEQGGFEKLKINIDLINNQEEESKQICQEVKNLFYKNLSLNNIILAINSQFVSEDKRKELIVDTFNSLESIKKDKNIDSRTIWGSIIGGHIGIIVTVIIIYITSVLTGKLFIIIGAACFFINFGIIWVFTKKTLRNPLVLILSTVSSVLATLIGLLLYNIF